MLMPIELMLAVACIAVLGVLNLWQLASSDPAVWKIVAVIRLIVEARVVWGFWTQNRQTGIAATVAAVMMATVSLYLLLGPLRDPQVLADISREEQRNSRIYFCIQAIAEIGVIVCVNLPKSRRHLSVVENN